MSEISICDFPIPTSARSPFAQAIHAQQRSIAHGADRTRQYQDKAMLRLTKEEEMNPTRKAAMRLACFIASIEGAKPVLKGTTYQENCDGLLTQYLSFTREQRKECRRKARKLIREVGMEHVAGHLVPVLPSPPRGSGKFRRHYLAYLRGMQLWGPDAPPCPVCKMAWCGLPKRLWSREQAEQIRLRQGDGLYVYPCPSQPGFFHLGH